MFSQQAVVNPPVTTSTDPTHEEISTELGGTTFKLTSQTTWTWLHIVQLTIKLVFKHTIDIVIIHMYVHMYMLLREFG